jgi:hypothetical protein
VAALLDVDSIGMARMVNSANAAMSFFMTYLLLPADRFEADLASANEIGKLKDLFPRIVREFVSKHQSKVKSAADQTN